MTFLTRYMLVAVFAGATLCTGCNTGEAPPDSSDAAVEPMPADLAIQEAMRAAERGEISGAAEFARRGLASEPENRELLFAASALLLQEAIGNPGKDGVSAAAPLEKAQPFADRLAETYEPLKPQERAVLATLAFERATVSASEGDTEQALTSLQTAIQFGFDDLSMIEDSTAWEVVRSQPEYESLAADLQQQIANAVQEEVAAEFADFEPFDFDFKLQGVDGETYTKEQFAGKILIVDLWGTWCPPCRMEIPHFIELQEKYSDEGLAILGVNYENVADEEAIRIIRDFQQRELEIPYPLALGDGATRAQVPNLGGFPTTLFIDREGKVRLKLEGYHRYESLEAIAKRLLAEGSPNPDRDTTSEPADTPSAQSSEQG